MEFSKYLGEAGLAELWQLMTIYIDNKIFIGTRQEYEAQITDIPIGAIVIITDEEKNTEPDDNLSSAILGSAILGKMVLGQT